MAPNLICRCCPHPNNARSAKRSSLGLPQALLSDSGEHIEPLKRRRPATAGPGDLAVDMPNHGRRLGQRLSHQSVTAAKSLSTGAAGSLATPALSAAKTPSSTWLK